ncbi:type II secretion system minor pseudopilin GspK [Kordiimonas sp.]|uniref:type II secretion system minor pseudopilin GspK n=1 Tax=Kordiimonas sp. TaxID=1970157 RepID=UPI003A8FDC3B
MKRLFHHMRHDKGAALVTVLLLVSVMSVGAVASFENLGFTIKRTTAIKMHQQAREYALGGEVMAKLAAEEMHRADAKLMALSGGGRGRAISYPIDGGVIEGFIEDTSNCFNVNSLVTATGGRLVANEQAGARYGRLLVALGLSAFEAERLTATLTDWIDSDSRPGPMGAEDYDYAALTPAYRAANTLLADISELRLIKGYEAEVRALVEPQLCARPTTEPVLLNANTLTPENAPLLVALVGTGLDIGAARRMIAERPAGGYADNASFWAERAFEGMALEQSVRARVGVKPQAFDAKISVQYHDARVELVSHLLVGGNGKATVAARGFGIIF